MLKRTSHKLLKVVTAMVLAIGSGNFAAAAQCENKAAGELALFSPAKGVWYTNSGDGCAFVAVKWGLASDKLVPADYDGDKVIDAAVWRSESGTWMIRRSSDAKAEIVKLDVAVSGDVPVPADYDGDGKAEIAIWRAATGQWISGNAKGEPRSVTTFGTTGDIPVPADYDGDRKADLAVFRGSENRWLILQSSDGRLRTEVFGKAGQDMLVPADYTGDGKADPAVYSSGKWTVLSSETGEIEPFVFGFADDVPVPGDYDGDGVTDFAVYRKGTWYFYDSGKPRFRTVNFGNEMDIPVNAALTKKSFSP